MTSGIRFLPCYTAVLRQVANPVDVIGYLSGIKDPVTIRFHGGDVLTGVSDRFWAMGMIMYCDYARRIGIYKSSDLIALNDIASDSTRRLRADPLSPGARFGYRPALLFPLVRKFRPKMVIETGVAQGLSTYVILKALHENDNNATLVSIDAPNYETRYVGSTREVGWLVPEDLRDGWRLELGRSSEILPRLNKPIDMFYHDSLHNYETMSFEFEWAYSHLVEEGVLASDDISASSAWKKFGELHPDMKTILPVRNFGNMVKSRSHFRGASGAPLPVDTRANVTVRRTEEQPLEGAIVQPPQKLTRPN